MLNKTTFSTIYLSFKHIKIQFKIFDVHINFIGQIDVHINFIGSGLSQCYCISNHAHTQCDEFKLLENLQINFLFIIK